MAIFFRPKEYDGTYDSACYRCIQTLLVCKGDDFLYVFGIEETKIGSHGHDFRPTGKNMTILLSPVTGKKTIRAAFRICSVLLHHGFAVQRFGSRIKTILPASYRNPSQTAGVGVKTIAAISADLLEELTLFSVFQRDITLSPRPIWETWKDNTLKVM